jgi:TetR/AcrR family transcriptional regulator
MKASRRAKSTTASNGGGTSVRDSERTREMVLEHSTKEFSTHGFDGARVDRIAARCRLSKNTLYYHFKSKDGLITAVMENLYAKLRSRQEETIVPSKDPEFALRHIIRQTFQAFVDNPEIIRLLNEENLHKARHIKKSGVLRELYDPLVDQLGGVLKVGARDGTFRPHIDPVWLYITMSSMAYHFIGNAFTFEVAFGRNVSSPENYEDWIAHITDVILSYCKSKPEKHLGSRKLSPKKAERVSA